MLHEFILHDSRRSQTLPSEERRAEHIIRRGGQIPPAAQVGVGKLHGFPSWRGAPRSTPPYDCPGAQTIPSKRTSSLRQLRMEPPSPWRFHRSCSRSLSRPNANSSRVMAATVQPPVLSALVSLHMKHQIRFTAEASHLLNCVVMSRRSEAVGGTWEPACFSSRIQRH